MKELNINELTMVSGGFGFGLTAQNAAIGAFVNTASYSVNNLLKNGGADLTASGFIANAAGGAVTGALGGVTGAAFGQSKQTAAATAAFIGSAVGGAIEGLIDRYNKNLEAQLDGYN